MLEYRYRPVHLGGIAECPCVRISLKARAFRWFLEQGLPTGYTFVRVSPVDNSLSYMTHRYRPVLDSPLGNPLITVLLYSLIFKGSVIEMTFPYMEFIFVVDSPLTDYTGFD